jgi:hypothetical protein
MAESDQTKLAEVAATFTVVKAEGVEIAHGGTVSTFKV